MSLRKKTSLGKKETRRCSCRFVVVQLAGEFNER